LVFGGIEVDVSHYRNILISQISLDRYQKWFIMEKTLSFLRIAFFVFISLF